MQKIPTVLVRDPEDMSRVLDQVTPGCEWVLAGEGVPTRKYDGTCVLLDEAGAWWARREVKAKKLVTPNADGSPLEPAVLAAVRTQLLDNHAPHGFVEVEQDRVTGSLVGWEPVEQSSFAKVHASVLRDFHVDKDDLDPGTYELLGPKVNGNPEGTEHHELRKHAEAEVADMIEEGPRTIAELVAAVRSVPWEGIVWHHPDGRMAKLKGRDVR